MNRNDDFLDTDLSTPLPASYRLRGGGAVYTPMSIDKENLPYPRSKVPISSTTPISSSSSLSTNIITTTTTTTSNNNSGDDDDDNDGANEDILNSMIGSLLDKDVRAEVKDFCFSQRGSKRTHKDTHSSSNSNNNNNNNNSHHRATLLEDDYMEEASPLPSARLPSGESAKKLRKTLGGPIPMGSLDDNDYNNNSNEKKEGKKCEESDDVRTDVTKKARANDAAALSSLLFALNNTSKKEVGEKQQQLLPATTTAEEDYYAALRANEERTRAGPNAMAKQPIINAEMRGILIDWLSEVADWYGLNEETLFLTVNYVDRFLGVRSVDKPAFQMLGLAAMFSASKYEELDPPTSSDFAAMIKTTRNTQINRMELILGAGIAFDYCVATPLAFLKAVSSFDKPTLLASFTLDVFQQAFSCAIVNFKQANIKKHHFHVCLLVIIIFLKFVYFYYFVLYYIFFLL